MGEVCGVREERGGGTASGGGKRKRPEGREEGGEKSSWTSLTSRRVGRKLAPMDLRGLDRLIGLAASVYCSVSKPNRELGVERIVFGGVYEELGLRPDGHPVAGDDVHEEVLGVRARKVVELICCGVGVLLI